MSEQVYLFIMITAMVVTAAASYVVNTRRFRKEFEERKRKEDSGDIEGVN